MPAPNLQTPILRLVLLFSSLFFAVTAARAGQVDTVEIFSPSMHKTVNCLVIRPDDYTFQGQPYPVLYLLHGWSGHFASWLTDAPQLRQLADTYQMLIVCPDGGYDSWYLDSPVDTTVRYDTHLALEVVPFIDHYYHTRRERQGRAIAGLSMGGHGALSVAIRHPDLFGAAGSMAGGLDLQPFRKNDWDLKRVLGNPRRHWKNWRNNSVVNLAPRLKRLDLQLLIDCGVDDFFIGTNREMHRRLKKTGIPHEYTERPGGHDHAYWSNAVDYQVLFFHKFFERAIKP